MVNKKNQRGDIFISTDNISYRVRNVLKIKDILRKIISAEKKKLVEATIIITDNDRMTELNENYLHHDTMTDTITFYYNDVDSEVFGDVYINLDMVRENAKLYHCSVKEELFRIMIHGVLHLCGYEDKKEEERKNIMLERQEKYLQMYLVDIM